jgi:NTE family protein
MVTPAPDVAKRHASAVPNNFNLKIIFGKPSEALRRLGAGCPAGFAAVQHYLGEMMSLRPLLPAGPQAWPPRTLSLALQGGGSFGAFTWGVLDALLADGRIGFEAISGASAGAVNAVLLASGLATGGRAGARAALDRFWRRLGQSGARGLPGIPTAALKTPDASLFFWTRFLSPYQFNPLDLNPLRAALLEEVDFAALRRQPLGLMIAATRVRDGRSRIFTNADISVEAVLASTCLPLLNQAVTLDGEDYWDGGYVANPPLMRLVAGSRARDVLLVQITPTVARETPTTSQDIMKRVDRIAFSAPLQTEIEDLSRICEMSRGLWGLASPEGRRLRRLRLHRVTAESELAELVDASAANLDRAFLERLRDAGRGAAESWLRSAAAHSRPLALETARRHLLPGARFGSA